MASVRGVLERSEGLGKDVAVARVPIRRSADYLAEDCGTDETLRGDARLDCVGVSPTCS